MPGLRAVQSKRWPGATFHRVGRITRRRRQRFAVDRDHDERAAVDVHRMDEAGVRADEADPDRLADLHPDRVRRRVSPPVDREKVWVRAVHRHRGEGQPFAQQPLLQLDRVLVIGLQRRIGLRRVDDQRAVQAQRLLPVDVVVRVVEEGARLHRCELVAALMGTRSPWRNLRRGPGTWPLNV